MKATIAISNMMLTASGLGFASYFVPGPHEAAALLICSTGLMLAGLILAVVVKIRHTRAARP